MIQFSLMLVELDQYNSQEVFDSLTKVYNMLENIKYQIDLENDDLD